MAIVFIMKIKKEGECPASSLLNREIGGLLIRNTLSVRKNK
jgi:hypothetical protein